MGENSGSAGREIPTQGLPKLGSPFSSHPPAASQTTWLMPAPVSKGSDDIDTFYVTTGVRPFSTTCEARFFSLCVGVERRLGQ